MNKRPAQGQGGDERYGAFGGQSQQDEMSDVPKQATAAQLAKRKIAQLKRRPRSESPLTNTGSIFEQANQNGLMGGSNTQPASNPFGGSSNFTFGNPSTNGASTPSFGSGGGSFNFGANNTQNSNQGGNAGFTFGSSATTPSSSFVFGQQQTQTSQSAQTNGSTPSVSFGFGQQPAQQNGGTSSFSFGQNDTTPKPATTNIFGNSFTAGQDSNAAPQNPFGAVQEPGKAVSTPFSNASSQQATAQKSAGGFTFGNAATEQPAQKSTGGFTFGSGTAQQQSDKTPQAQNNLFAGLGQQKAADPPKTGAASNGWTTFTQSKPSTPVTNGINGTSGSSSSLFAPSAQTTEPNAANSGAGIFSGLNQQPAKTPTFQFIAQNDTAAADNDYSMMSPENTPQKPSAKPSNTPLLNGSGVFKQSIDADSATPAPTPKPAFDFGKGASLFDRISKNDAPPQTPATSTFKTPASTEGLFKPQASLFASAQPSNTTSDDASSKAVLFAQPASTPAAYHLTTEKETSMSSTKQEHFADVRELNESLLQHLQGQDVNRDWTTIFRYYQSEVAKIQQRSQPTSSKPSFMLGNSVLNKSTATSSQGAKQRTSSGLAQHDGSTPPEQPLYPQLPPNASNTAKLFQATLDKSATPKASATSLFSPSVDALQTKDASTAPATGGFRPAGVSSAGSSFLSSFGQKAAETADKEKKRRKDEDFDSDEDNEAEWEKKDAQEQEARRARLAEASKTSTGFVFKPTGASSDTLTFTGFGKPASTATQQPSSSTLFNFNPSANSTTPSAPTATPKLGLFGAPSTPAATSNGTSSLFSNAAQSSTPAPLFTLKQPNSTPAVSAAQSSDATQDGASAEAEEGDAAPPEPQADDMAILLPSETSENEVIFHAEKSKSRKLEPRAAEGGVEKLTWVDKGLGPLWILRNKSTGKSRVLQKIKDSGRAAMNFAVLAGDESMYKHEGMNGKAVTTTFVDHIGSSSGKPTRWIIMVGKAEDAKEIARILREEQKHA